MNLSIPNKLANFIGGEFVAPINNQYLDCINPATAEVFTQIPNSSSEDIEQAVQAAQQAFSTWSITSVEQRFKILNKIADLIDEHLEELALAETTDNGKPLWLSKRMDIPRAAANFRFFATGIMHFASESHAMEDKVVNYTLRQPIGIVGCISPWNLPLYLFTWKIAPALAAGNCVIAKPSEVTPVTAYLLAKLCEQAGLPNGVLNIVHGTGPQCGEAIVQHKAIKAISFTGSTKAGERIASIAAPRFKKLSLELGGKNPAIIFSDCNWDKMMQETIRSSFTNQGQICLCTSRILIEESIYEKFKAEFVEKAKALTVGNPLLADSRQGAIVSEVHFNKIMSCIAIAKEEGGIILCGGNAVQVEGECSKGYFIQPTVIEGLGSNTITNQEEIFGPVVTLQSFKTTDEAMQLANATSYGLQSTIWTQDVSKAYQLSNKSESGIVWVNCWLQRDLRTPFGGVKNSGVGREGGWDALKFFSEVKNVCVEI
jgi:aminomuconate-semialdehyde/2-hydroxymuconate-6-semialdehyde dehydrogenase